MQGAPSLAQLRSKGGKTSSKQGLWSGGGWLGRLYEVQEISGIYGNENTGQRSPQIKMEKVPCVRAIKGGEDMCSSGSQMLVVKIPVGPAVGPGATLRDPRGGNTENKKGLLKPSNALTPGFTEHTRPWPTKQGPGRDWGGGGEMGSLGLKVPRNPSLRLPLSETGSLSPCCSQPGQLISWRARFSRFIAGALTSES